MIPGDAVRLPTSFFEKAGVAKRERRGGLALRDHVSAQACKTNQLSCIQMLVLGSRIVAVLEFVGRVAAVDVHFLALGSDV